MSIFLGNDGENLARPLAALGVVFAVCASLTGCQSPYSTANLWKLPDFTRVKAPDLSAVKKPLVALSKPVDYGIEKIQGPTQRILQAADWRRAPQDPQAAVEVPPEARIDYNEAEQLYKQGDFDASEKAFKKIAKKYKDTPVEEDAMFMGGESAFERKRYASAQDSYERLLKKYPSSRHLDDVTSRLYVIARQWLGFKGTEAGGDIRQASMEEAVNDPAQLSDMDNQYYWPIVPNLLDHTRPIFDTNGRALEALKSIWLNDPTGPLADDALMLTASYYVRQQNYLEADHILQIIREDCPKSPHLQQAFLLGSHVKLMSYKGPQYDGKRLEEARRLKESTLRLFPEIPERDMIVEELHQIDAAAADRYWTRVKYYQRKKKPKAVAVYCKLILKEYPNSEFADRARTLLAEVEPQSEYLQAIRPVPAAAAGMNSGESQSNQENVAGRARL